MLAHSLLIIGAIPLVAGAALFCWCVFVDSRRTYPVEAGWRMYGSLLLVLIGAWIGIIALMM